MPNSPITATLRPFFLSQLASAKGWSAIESFDNTPRSFLVERFLQREANLIGENLGDVSPSTIRTALIYLFEEIALEMVDTETESVDLAFLQVVTEMAFGQVLEESDLAKLKHKAGSFALLEVDQREGHRRFPHTEISNHFLASGVIRLLSNGAQARFLRRASLSSDFLNIFSEAVLKISTETSKTLTRCLERIVSSEGSFDRLPENCAALLMGSLVRNTDTDRDYSDLSAADVVLFGKIAKTTLSRTKIQRLDIREAELSDVNFHDCEVTHLERQSSGVHADFIRMKDPLQFLTETQTLKIQDVRRKIRAIPK